MDAYLGLDAFQLKLLTNISSLTLFNLQQTYHLTSTQLNAKITAFNANFNSSINTFNAYLQNPLTHSLIDLAAYQTFFSLFANDENIIKYCNQYGFDNNLLADSNNSLLSNFQIKVYNQAKGIYSVNFDINNLINYSPLLNDKCFYVPDIIQLQDYSTPVEGFFYLSPTLLNPSSIPIKKVVPAPVNSKPVKVEPTPVKKVIKPSKKVVVTPPIPKKTVPAIKVQPVKKVVPSPIKKVVVSPKPIVKPVAKPIVINNNQPILTKATNVPP
ncbi:hypothetical protein J6W20_05365 [bacterium]|nr:hypothetical protein [bacterium]